MKCNIKRIICLLICATFVSTLFTITANADTGPKPSVRITFENMGGELCYATLLSKTPSTGPNSAWDGDDEHIYNETLNLDIWRAFVDYADEDGYYFLQIAWQVNKSKELAWTYYPPDDFKILLYYPEADTYFVSGICGRYAFDTYYTVDMTGIDIGSVVYDAERSNDVRLNACKSYQWQQETISLVVRIVITIVIEMGAALLFGFREKKTLLLLAAVNAATQIILNVLLNLINYRSGPREFVLRYIALELAVFVIEAVFYAVLMKKFTEKAKPAWFYVVYAFIANAVSFGAGLAIAKILPGIF